MHCVMSFKTLNNDIRYTLKIKIVIFNINYI